MQKGGIRSQTNRDKESCMKADEGEPHHIRKHEGWRRDVEAEGWNRKKGTSGWLPLIVSSPQQPKLDSDQMVV